MPLQCCGNNFADGYGKMQLFALAATWTRLNIHLDKHLKLNTWTGLAWDDKCKPQHIPTVCVTEGKKIETFKSYFVIVHGQPDFSG